ncbi:hypothetical protein [Devosia oryzisoli]|uniref:hypothetical protein n=1 Tax=Devosia oryzisoli TaxID=2774138 RepID=UPI003D13797C
MAQVTYTVVEHNGGFAYRVGDVFSETFATHKAAHEAAESAAQRQQMAGEDEQILYQDAEGKWHEEFARADSHPQGTVQDDLPEDEELRDRNGEAVSEDEVPNPDRMPLRNDLHRDR